MNFYKDKVKSLINDEKKFSDLAIYVDLIEEKNKVMNLTGFTGDILWKEGIYESLVYMKTSFENKINESNKNFLDVGAGAGFPSVPFLILHPEIKLTIYEPIKKRVAFLNIVKEKLKLTNLVILPIRAEESKDKEKFDFICARAVMDFGKIFEITHHVAKVGAYISFIKGPKVFQELENSRKIVSIFDEEINIEQIDIFEDKQNYLINYVKRSKTPQNFPRKWDKILKENNEKY
ncbi:16S rRNA (guanine(527)-N(7))-methyltransferase RsmG [Mesomycoplasma molare]|uniref:Ribosomal RNA small subunit methyltransferase G n=1 Tax=Mesomycoplasma molare TaxID=171288 RepID=A0ABY5TUT3_9BACT|nr:16S rRNA (guanine(527)-N(7))-methyltransferase RsmG [Mesomycoplasma molare]UWD34412.1 16S rRNA (guanine(527)-N(7))-methyltransferase RsmG [Mesomycoplasma molare]